VPASKRKTRLTSRQFHRWLGIGAAVLFLLVSATGVALQYQQIFGSEEAAKEAAASIVSPLSLAEPAGLDPSGPDTFRRIRQGAEIDLPRFSDHLRVAGVYEIDLTNTNAFGLNPGPGSNLNSRGFENLFVAVQDADDPANFRLLFGHNTSILSREDNLSSGNLPTVDQHGSGTPA